MPPLSVVSLVLLHVQNGNTHDDDVHSRLPFSLSTAGGGVRVDRRTETARRGHVLSNSSVTTRLVKRNRETCLQSTPLFFLLLLVMYLLETLQPFEGSTY